MDRPRPLIVLGSGPVGLLSAIRGRQLGLDVEIHASERPLSQEPPRVECVPAQVIALLVEFGVNPKLFGADTLFNERIVQWSDRTASKVSTPGVAHVGRPALDIALLEAALRAGARFHATGAVRLDEFKQRHRKKECWLLDASGRSAVTAIRRACPRRPIVARLFHLPMRPSLRSSALMIAAGPEGYAYRMANAATLTIGVVGRKELVRGDGRQIVAAIADFAPWLVEDIPGESMQPGGSGPASVQWSHGDGTSLPIGDACFARDALASQGLAIGLSDALKTLAQPDRRADACFHADRQRAICVHGARVVEQIGSSLFRSSEPWIEYAQFLSDVAIPNDDALATTAM
jgi:hypothetical protein